MEIRMWRNGGGWGEAGGGVINLAAFLQIWAWVGGILDGCPSSLFWRRCAVCYCGSHAVKEGSPHFFLTYSSFSLMT